MEIKETVIVSVIMVLIVGLSVLIVQAEERKEATIKQEKSLQGGNDTVNNTNETGHGYVPMRVGGVIIMVPMNK